MLAFDHTWMSARMMHVETLDGGWPDKAGIIAKPTV
jgi:hypothetical protein